MMSQTDLDNRNGNGGGFGNLLSLVADISLKIGHLTKHLQDKDKLQKAAYRYSQPVFYTNGDQAQIITGGIGIIRLAGPDQGHVWYPQGLNFYTDGNAGVETAMPGRAEIFISAADHRSKTALNQFSPVDWRDTVPQLPNVVHYSRSQIVQRFNEEMYVVFTGATVGLTYGATLWTLDYEEAAMREGWTL